MKITCSKCGEFLDLSRVFKYRYCKDCHNQYERGNRKKYIDLSEEQKIKVDARKTARRALRRREIKKERCEICGIEETEMHHEDYSKPLEVKWLCREHHLEHHHKNGYV